MGFFGNILAGKRAQAAKDAPAASVEYIPAGQTLPVARTRDAIVDRAGRFYRENPKLVASVGVAAALGILASLTRKPRV